MRLAKRRYQFRIDPLRGEELERLAQLRQADLSDTIAYLVGRGLEREAHRELTQFTSLVESLGEHVEQLQAHIEMLEAREAERFRLLLGHHQQHQAMGTETLHLQRQVLNSGQPGEYPRILEGARRQVSDDAAVYRASLAAGGPARRPESGGKSGPVA